MQDSSASAPRILARPQHPISRKNISENAVKVLYRLHRSGHASYLVGGGVRDLMLGRRPKDFDIGTDARPDEIRRLFRNSRIIGRRFRIVHIYFRQGIVEVSTFRRDPDPEAQESAPDELLITDDNVFGTPRQDAFRRDFTVNALFYDVADFSVIDFVGGIEDLEARVIRTIGDPEVRFREDPVRMLRACELAGRLDFSIEPSTQEAIRRHRREIEKASPARMTEEIVECLGCGDAAAALRWMRDLGLLEVFLPEAFALVHSERAGLAKFSGLLRAVDESVRQGDAPSQAVLLAALLLPSVLLGRRDLQGVDQQAPRRGALQELIQEVVEPFFQRFTLSRYRRDRVLKSLLGYFRLQERMPKPAVQVQIASKPWFDDALSLLRIVSSATSREAERVEAWQRARERTRTGGKSGQRGGARRRQRRRRRK